MNLASPASRSLAQLAGRREQACAANQKAVANDDWASISFIAAEKEIAAGACKPLKKR